MTPAGAAPATGFAPNPAAEAEQVEVTQPYIPAIRDEAPEFAKRHSPSAPPREPSAPTPPPARAAEPTVATAPAAPVPARTGQGAPEAKPAPKRKSLARRVVRRIIGPHLLRKDPPKNK